MAEVSAELEHQKRLLKGLALFCRLLETMPDMVLVLNRQRQTVFANRAFTDFIVRRGLKSPFGKTPGQLLLCQNAERPGGCGATAACANCGTTRTIAAAVESALAGEPQECRIQAQSGGEDLDLLLSATPLRLQDEEFLLFSALDVSDSDRRKSLEAVFYHDALNTAGGIRAMAELIKDVGPARAPEFIPRIEAAASMLIEQITGQRDLARAEQGELPVHVSEVSTMGLLREMCDLFRAHPAGQGKGVVVADGSEDIALRTDATLLRRVLGNLVKNALEAEGPGARVSLFCWRSGERAAFAVHNPTPIPADVKAKVFQKSFSTKGGGRGLGTYGVRLITERYLKGRASFAVDEDGTRFTVEYPLRLS